MEENNNNTVSSTEHKCKNETFKMLLAAFVGGFLAIYFVADQVFDKSYAVKQYYPDKMERQMIKDFNKMYERQKKAFEHDFAKFDNNFADNFEKKSSKIFSAFTDNANEIKTYGVKIKSELDDDEYKIIVDLKPFDGDESKVNYNFAGRKITVFGSSKVKDKNFSQDISFSHDFLLPENADISRITKEKDDNKLVIKVPFKN